MTRHLACLIAVLVAAALALVSGRAAAVDRNFAGSAQVDYHFVPTQGGNLNAGDTPGKYGFDGFTLEASEKLAVDVSDHVSGNVKVCFGCHGFELDMTYLDFRVVDELNIRAGRFSPSFGSFNLRHDVANHKLSDKPLPYDMGRMLRLRTWRLGVLPSPFPDTGVELNGSHWFGSSAQFDYAAYAVQGFRSADPHPLDVDFVQSRQLYYVDDNARPTFGGRLALTYKLGSLSDMTLGASGMAGTYDNNNLYWYTILGADFVLRIYRTNVRVEYLVRRTDFDTSDPSRFALAVAPTNGNFYVKHGAYVEVEQPLSGSVDLIGRVDGMLRAGNFAADPTGETLLSARSTVVRYTLGTSYAFERSFRLKMSVELWQWSDADEQGRKLDVGLHTAFVGTF